MMTQVRYELPDQAYEAYTWLLQDEHTPASQPPLLTGPDSTGATSSSEPTQRLRINGYTYIRAAATEASPFGQPSLPESVDDLTRWRTEWLPQVAALSHELESFDPGTVQSGTWASILEEQEREYQRVFAGVHRTAVGPSRLAADRFMEAFVARFGDDRRHETLAFLQGFPNRSLDRAIALWDLSRLVRADPELASALDRRAELPDSPLAGEFEAGLAGLLKEFGYTNSKQMQDSPTWKEDPAIPLAIVRAYARQDDDRSSREAARQQAERRVQLERELRTQAQTDPSLAPLIPLMEMAQQLLPNLEDHNLLADQRMGAVSRARWLSLGRLLQQRGMVALPDDVFYYRRNELVLALEKGEALSLDEIAERCAFQDACRLTPPPPVLGKPLDTPLIDRLPTEAEGTFALRGAPASPGSYRGRARVIESFSDANSLVEGDVLVCRSTTPPWTPFFGIISAVVTNSGGILSHGAIVAREFGIPAVVGTRNATVFIPDGATVTVDGTAGLVIVEA